MGEERPPGAFARPIEKPHHRPSFLGEIVRLRSGFDNLIGCYPIIHQLKPRCKLTEMVAFFGAMVIIYPASSKAEEILKDGL